MAATGTATVAVAVTQGEASARAVWQQANIVCFDVDSTVCVDEVRKKTPHGADSSLLKKEIEENLLWCEDVNRCSLVIAFFYSRGSTISPLNAVSARR